MKIKRIFTSAVPISILMCASLVYADSHEMKAAGEMMKEAGDTAASAVKKVTTAASNAGTALPNAKAGECYAKVIIPAEYKTETQTVTTKEATSKISIIPAKYQWVEEKVLVKEASKKLIPVPATYKKVSEKVLVTPAEKVWTTGATKKSGRVNASTLAGAVANGLNLGDAKIGNCYAEYHIPAQYKTETQQVLKSEASQKIEIIPAKYSWAEESVLVKDASSKLVAIPAVYETVTEQILVKPATTEWKKGRGPVERLDGSTGEIMCLIEIPAVYKKVSKRVLKSPASTKKIEIPAERKVQKVRKLVTPAREKRIEIPATYEAVTKRSKVADEKVMWAVRSSKIDGKATGAIVCLKELPAVYKTIQQKKVQTAAITKVVEVPAEYKMIKRRKLVSPAIEKKIEIPAKTQVVSREIKVTEESMQWRPILCETNMNSTLITDIQRALKKSGHNPGPIDGVIGHATMVAVDSFQLKNGLPRGGLTLRTLEKLGIRI
ncbi:MAG: peptidoglycan-binding domain-containing protein [Gammaproteobacteria bacterium]|nr:peptidoglycan-binding domain-containing protein [Gammaproteobacteria bacterium]